MITESFCKKPTHFFSYLKIISQKGIQERKNLHQKLKKDIDPPIIKQFIFTRVTIMIIDYIYCLPLSCIDIHLKNDMNS